MRPAGAATPKIVVYLVFALLIAAIATFATIGYRTFQRDMYLPQKFVTIAMHDPAALQPTVYAMKEPGEPKGKGAPKNPAKDPKKGQIVSVTLAPMERATASFSEKLAWIFAWVAVVVFLAGVLVIVKKRWKTGAVITLVGGIALAFCLWKAAYLKAHRMPPSDIVIMPDEKGDTKTQPITLLTDSSTTVRIDGEEMDVKALTPGLKVQATLADDNKTAVSIISPIPEKRRAMLRLPEGFRGSVTQEDPRYLTSVELKEQYLFQCFLVQRGTEVIQVAQVKRDPLSFTAFARSTRLSALHDYKHGLILEEGPTFIQGARQVKWERGEDSPFNLSGVNAFTLVVEGEDENGVRVRSRQIVIQGEGTNVYVIKATAPVSEWPRAGEIFESVISTFEVADASAASTEPASEPATAAAATSPATIPVEMH
jgi:hypothetical protein